LLGIGFSENHRAASVADELVGTLDHAMALAGSGGQNLAGAGDLEPLLRGRLGLHLGHFAFLSLRSVAGAGLLQADQSLRSIRNRHGMPCRAALRTRAL